MLLLNANDFGLPQRRQRLFIIGISQDRAQKELLNSPEQVLDSAVLEFLPLFEMKPPPVETWMHQKRGKTAFFFCYIYNYDNG